MLQRFVAGAVLQGEGDAIGGGDADQRRAAHQHGADGMGGVGERAQVARGDLVRQQGLVEDDDGVAFLADREQAVGNHDGQL